MSQKLEYISLEELVQQSDWIAVVRKSSPFQVSKKKLTSMFPWKPRFIYQTHHYEVQEVLFRNEYLSPITTTIIAVKPAHFSTRLRVHKLYHNKGVRKIPIYQRYESTFHREQEERLIIFCSYLSKGKGLSYKAESSWESVERKEEILSIIHAQQTK